MPPFLDLRDRRPPFPFPPEPDDVLRRAESGGPLPDGQYGMAWTRGRDLFLARDPLGVFKFFHGRRRSDGAVVVADRIATAAEAGVRLDDLCSCPPGHVVRLTDGAAATVVGGEELSSLPARTDLSLADFQREVRATLEKGFADLARNGGHDVHVVCLSGGLDSSVVASLAARFLPNAVGVTFSYLNDRDAGLHLRGASPAELPSVSDDVRSAMAVAEALRLPLRFSARPPSAVGSAVRAAVALCQDWRDFNVHCATVNLFLAQDIRALFPGMKVAVLTGDLMNEFMCDYHEEIVEGTVYYPQPRVGLEKRRRFFVRGLDAGDREVGVFSAFGLDVIQPYALVARDYMALPGEALAAPDAKLHINGPLLDGETRAHIGKSKRRAQVGGEDFGTLGHYHRLGLGPRDLERIWAEGLPEAARGDRPHDIIQFGRYRTTPREG